MASPGVPTAITEHHIGRHVLAGNGHMHDLQSGTIAYTGKQFVVHVRQTPGIGKILTMVMLTIGIIACDEHSVVWLPGQQTKNPF